MIIAIDFDGTLVEHEYPAIGPVVPGAFEALEELLLVGHDLILWTVRVGVPLKEALDFCEVRGIYFLGVNENPTQKYWSGSPKAYAEMYIDDAALGCPLIHPDSSKRPYVDWVRVKNHPRWPTD